MAHPGVITVPIRSRSTAEFTQNQIPGSVLLWRETGTETWHDVESPR